MKNSTFSPQVLFFLLSFLLIQISIIHIASGQSTHCIPGMVQNDNNDPWSEECYLDDNCELQGNPCSANDVVLLGVFPADSLGGPIPVHHVGDSITFYLWGTFHNGTGTDRHAVRTVSEVIVQGTYFSEINSCSFDLLPSGNHNVILLGEVSYICGDLLQLQNTWVAWSTTHGQCSDPAGANYDSECGDYPPAQCSQEFNLIDFLAPNFQYACGDATATTTEICFTDLSEGGTPPYTYQWDFGDGGTSTEANPCHTYQAITGVYEVVLTITDSNGVQAAAALDLSLDSLDCCLLTINCPPLNGGTYDCVENVPEADPGAITVVDSCGPVTITITDQSSGTGCGTDTMTITREYFITDGSSYDTCVQILKVIDDQSPVITCPDDVTVTCVDDIPDADPDLIVYTDNCDSASTVTHVGDTVTSQTCMNRLTIERTYQVEDACGNTATCIQIITVYDGISPAITCPANITVSCASDVPAANTTSAVTSDNCGGTITVTVSQDNITNQVCANQYTITRVYTATDVCGNSATCEQTITVNDAIPPAITCPSDITVTCAANVPAANTGSVTASDNCGGIIDITVAADIITNEICENRYTITRIYTATDICGNSATCAQTITVFDGIGPSITCPADLSVTCSADVPAANTALVTTSDNCGGTVDVTVAQDIITNQDCENQYIITRIYIATDICGNTATCAQTITVYDGIAPTINCPSDVTVTCAADVPAANTSLITTGDNCGGLVDVSAGQDIITNQLCENQYTITRIYTATDLCGNTATCAQTITVFDGIAPTITCPNDITVTCAADVPAANTSLVTTDDNCGGLVDVTVATDIISNEICENQYTITRIYTATDVCGNTATCAQIITVFDDIAPIVTCPNDVTVTCAADVPAPNTTSVTASDNCTGIGTITVANDIFTNQICANRYVIIRVYTVTDACGNSATCAQTITVFDDVAPIVTCPSDVTVTCAADVPSPNTASVTASDNCGGFVDVTVAADIITNQVCENQYTITRIYTAMDACGNTATCAQTITVLDGIPPTVTCPNDITVTCAADVPAPDTTSVTASDNCGGFVDVTVGQDIITNQNCENQYDITRIYTATDLCGNSATCAQTITVFDDIAPIVTCPNDVTVTCAADVPAPNTASVTASDNCGGLVDVTVASDIIANEVCENQYTITRIYTATDVCGNSATCAQTITVFDGIAPTISCPADVTVSCAADVPASNTTSVTASDNCAGIGYITVDPDIITNQICENQFTITRIYTATDACGNSATCEQTITVFDDIAPIITCPNDVTVTCAADVPAANTASVTASDNCGGVVDITVAADIIMNEVCENQYTISRIYTATDQCGNTATCAQIITVFDGIAPTISCPNDVTVTCASDVPAANTTTVTASDNCEGIGYITVEPDILTNQICANRYTILRVYTATDACGNSATCMQVISVFDDIAPTITCPADITVTCAADVPPSNTATIITNDNCAGTVTVTVAPDIISNQVCANQYTITRTYTAIDICGNSATCSQIITVYDEITPSITAPADVTVECANQVPPVNPASASGSDNCGGAVTLSFLGDAINNQSCVNQFILTRAYQATDVCGNSATDTQLIYVGDYEAPVITFTDPLIAGVPNGGTVLIQCYGQDPLWDLPVLNENSVDVTDNCGVQSINFNQTLEDEADCRVDGYINIFRLTWTASDSCSNTSSAHVFLKLVDTIPPVIHDVPADITVSADNIPDPPNLYATDECLCSCIVYFENFALAPGCMDGMVMRRAWEATDDCGNVATAEQFITLVDDRAPELFFIQPELVEMEDGAIIEYTCNEGGIPEYYNHLDEQSVNAIDASAPVDINFFEESMEANNCEFSGFIEQRTFRWEGIDACGNIAQLSFTIRLIDNEAPVLTGIPDMICVDDPLLTEVDAIDNCGESHVRYWDVSIPNPCGSGQALRRTYEAYDNCGNIATDTTVLIPDDNTAPFIEFVNQALIDVDPGSIMIIECEANNGYLTTYGVNDVKVTDPCMEGVKIDYSENITEPGNCIEGLIASIEMRWTATDICGNSSVLSLHARIMDTTPPEFINLQGEVTIGCNDEMPQINAGDNCSDVFIDISETKIPGPCLYEYDIIRSLTAIDECGNLIAAIQTVHVGDGKGPIIKGVQAELCNDLSMPDVTAFDPCAGIFVDVAMTEDTLDTACEEGYVIERTWSAVDECGNRSEIKQQIVMGDYTPPEIQVPTYSIIHTMMDMTGVIRVNQSHLKTLQQLDELDDSSVFAVDECDQQIIPVFSMITSYAEDCITEGYFERRTYSWTATDVCGNATQISFTVDIIDDLPPVFVTEPLDETAICATVPEVPEIQVYDLAEPVSIVYTEFTKTIAPGEYLIKRIWTATDACGNISVTDQVITWIPDTYVTCNIITPKNVECNTHGVLIQSEVTGGISPFTYLWEVVGEDCFIQGGQRTPEIFIYIGWSEIQISLTVTDAFGCNTVCRTSLDCFYPNEASFAGNTDAKPGADFENIKLFPEFNHGKDQLNYVNFWPNPAKESVYVSFESEQETDVQMTLMNLQGQVILNERLAAQKGFNSQKIDVAQIHDGAVMIKIAAGNELHTKIIVLMGE